MSENNNTIRNVVTLEVGQFDAAIDKTSKRLGELDKRLEKTGQEVAQLERSFGNLTSHANSVATKFSILDKSLGANLLNMTNLGTATDRTAKASKKLEAETKALNKQTEKAKSNTDKLTDFTKKYDDKLSKLGKTTKEGTAANKKLKESVVELGNAQAGVSKRALQSSDKSLQKALRNNDKELASHKKSLKEIELLKRESQRKVNEAQRDLDSRYFGKNANSQSAKAIALREALNGAKAELNAITAVHSKVANVVSGLQAQNLKLREGADLVYRQNQALEAQIALRNRLKQAQDQQNLSLKQQAEMHKEQLRLARIGPTPYSQLSFSQRQSADQMLAQAHLKSGSFVGAQTPSKAQIDAQKYYAKSSNFVGPPISSMVPYSQHQASLNAMRQAYNGSASFMGPSPASKAQRDMQAYYQNSKNFVGPYPANSSMNTLSFGAQKALQDQATRAQRQAHDEQMRNLRQQQAQQNLMHREQMTFAKELALMYTTMRVNQSMFGAVHQNSELEQAKYRLSLWNLPGAEEQRFIDKSKALTIEEKYLTHTESIDARLDAMAAMGGNHEKTIDDTIATATRVAHVLRATGNESGSNSDLVKNIYGFAEARQVMNNKDEVNRSSEILLKISEISNGKIKVADVETVARNMGSMRADVSADGWLAVAALAEQFKTAGGGNGGGGGVATVGTMLKMMGLYGSGRTITNRAVENLYGADMLNEFDGGDAAKAFKDNAKQTKEFIKVMKNAGFKDTKSMGEDPVKFFANLRGKILDSMMDEKNFERYFGEGTERWTYNNKGQMVKKDGSIADSAEQNKVEQAGFTRWASQMGWSNRMVDGMVTMLNKNFIDRAREVTESGKRAADSKQALAEAQSTLKGNTDNLMAALGRLAESFAPLLPLVTGVVGATTSFLNILTGIVSAHPAIAVVTGLGLAFGAASLAVTVFIGKAALIRGVLAGMATHFGATAAAAKGTAVAVTTVGAASTTAAASSAAASTSILARMGGLLKWAGWAGLAGIMGWAIGTWIRDIEVRGVTVSQHAQNLINDIVISFQAGFQNIRIGWNSLLSSISFESSGIYQDAQRALNEARGAKQDIANRRDQLHTRTNDDAKNARAVSLVSRLKAVEKSGKATKVSLDAGKTLTVRPGKENQERIRRLEQYDANKVMPFTLPKNKLSSDDVAVNQAILSSLKGETLERELRRNKALSNAGNTAQAKTESKKDLALPTPSNLADYSPKNPFSTGTGGGGKASEKPEPKARQEREWNNPFYASLKDIEARTQRTVNTSEELGKAPNYESQARDEFIRKWTAGDFDPSNDPRSRMFTSGNYDSKGGWKVEQINWGGVDTDGNSVADWLVKEANRLRNDDIAKGLKAAAERVGTTRDTLANALENYEQGVDVDSRQGSALSRQFARQEIKTPVVKDNAMYDQYKREAITNQATIDYANFALESKKYNEQLQIDLMTNEVEKRRMTADLVYREEVKKIEAIRKLLDDQIADHIAANTTTSQSYLDAVKAKEKMEQDFTLRVQLENEKRLRASETAIQGMMRGYGDLNTSLENFGANWMKQGMDAAKELISGQISFSDLDWRQIGADVAGDFAGAFFDKFVSDMYTSMMGETNFFDVFKSMLGGEGGLFAKAAGMLGIGGSAPVSESGASNPVATATTEVTGAMGQLSTKIKPLQESMGRLWQSASDTAGGLWQLAGDAIAKAISAISTWASSLLASSATGGGGGGGLGGILGTLVSAGASYFGGGANMGSFAGVAAETGSSFGGTTDFGLQFAKGGAFTNGLYDSPTPFMFANGGTFGNLGVMGEAGPEAVMPLTRDSSGRLGVSAQGAMGGVNNMQSNQVNIEINVSQDGSASTSAGDAGQEWKQMANSVRAVVMEELSRQSRPGGINYKK